MPKPTPKPTSLRDSLARKQRPSRSYRFLTTDPTESEQMLAAAQQELRMALLGGDEQRKQAARETVEQAETAIDQCWHTIKLVSVPAKTFTDLMATHKPTREQKQDGAEWNPDTFHPALIAACAQDERLTAEEWTAEFASDRWSQGERNTLFNLALDVNISPSRQPFDRLRLA